jgi:hypothetical protein
MTGELLFSTEDRAKAHAHAEAIRADYPRAECREDPNEPQPYQVWSGPQKD